MDVINSRAGAKLLVVDDEPDILVLLERGLQRKGFKVDAFTDPKQALAAFDALVHEVALLDIRMPEMNGLELARELLQIKPELQVCFLTSNFMNVNELRATIASYRPVCYLQKPMALDAVANHVQECFTQRR